MPSGRVLTAASGGSFPARMDALRQRSALDPSSTRGRWRHCRSVEHVAHSRGWTIGRAACRDRSSLRGTDPPPIAALPRSRRSRAGDPTRREPREHAPDRATCIADTLLRRSRRARPGTVRGCTAGIGAGSQRRWRLAQTRSPREWRACASRARWSAALAPYRSSICRDRHPPSRIRSPSVPPSASQECANVWRSWCG